MENENDEIIFSIKNFPPTFGEKFAPPLYEAKDKLMLTP